MESVRLSMIPVFWFLTTALRRRQGSWVLNVLVVAFFVAVLASVCVLSSL